jgi:hypothetical protein
MTPASGVAVAAWLGRWPTQFGVEQAAVRRSLDPLDQVTAGSSSLPWLGWGHKID